jgi:hypothetical protein
VFFLLFKKVLEKFLGPEWSTPMMENVDAGGVHCEYILPYFSHAHKHRKKQPDGSFGIINFHLVSNSAHQSSIWFPIVRIKLRGSDDQDAFVESGHRTV